MTALFLTEPLKQILVVSPIYDELETLFNIEYLSKDYDWTVINGGICYPNDDLDAVVKRIEIIQNMIDTKKIIYNVGREDFLLLKQLDTLDAHHSIIEKWIFHKPNAVIANFPHHSVVIVGGGIPSTIKTQADLFNNLEVSFLTNIDQKPWHDSYDGRLGYVISSSPTTLGPPQFYSYSMQLGNYYGPDSEMYAQEVSESGLNKTIIL